MARIKIKKGHDIQISGVPAKEIEPISQHSTVAIHPNEFRYCKPKLMVKEGDTVKISTPLFHDKNNPDIVWGSPGAGTVSAVHYGHRRVIEKIIIDLDKQEEAEQFSKFDHHKITELSGSDVKDQIMKAGLWPVIRQRPFNKVASPADNPHSIFISCYNSAPLSVDLDVALRNRRSSFQAGINALSRLTEGDVHIVIKDESVSETFIDLQHAKNHYIRGPHPAGNVGIQIHHIDSLKPGKIIWTIDAQHVVTLGRLFLKGQFDPRMVMTVGGPSSSDPIHISTRIGSSIKTMIDGRMKDEPKRIVSGDILTGTKKDLNDHVGFYHTSIGMIPHSDDREFMGMLRLGTSSTRYSLTNSFLSFGNNEFDFTTRKNGEERAMIPINSWEDVLPMDIYPNPLYRAILADDVEEMEQLGLLECDDEDFALCSFACPSKLDIGSVIRQGLDILEAEG